MSKRTDLPRNARDFYATPYKAVAPLIKFIDDGVTEQHFIEPCAGDGRLVSHIFKLSDRRITCRYASDIFPLPQAEDYHMVTKTQDVLTANWQEISGTVDSHMFITNPPWLNNKDSGYLLNTIIQTLCSVRPTWVLLNANYLFNIRSSALLKQATDVVVVGRVKWIEGSKHSSTEDSAWFKFDPQTATGNGPIVHPRKD